MCLAGCGSGVFAYMCQSVCDTLHTDTHADTYCFIPSHAALKDKLRMRVSGLCSCNWGGFMFSTHAHTHRYIQSTCSSAVCVNLSEHMTASYQQWVCLGTWKITPVVRWWRFIIICPCPVPNDIWSDWFEYHDHWWPTGGLMVNSFGLYQLCLRILIS